MSVLLFMQFYLFFFPFPFHNLIKRFDLIQKLSSSVLPMRFCEKVGFILEADKATAYSYSHIQTAENAYRCKNNKPQLYLQPILLVRRWKMVIWLWGSLRPFLTSWRTRGLRTPFSFFFLFSLHRRIWLPFCSTNFLVLLAQASSTAILFAENRYIKQSFSTETFFFTKSKPIFFFLQIFSTIWKTKYGDFQEEWKMPKNGSTASSSESLWTKIANSIVFP